MTAPAMFQPGGQQNGQLPPPQNQSFQSPATAQQSAGMMPGPVRRRRMMGQSPQGDASAAGGLQMPQGAPAGPGQQGGPSGGYGGGVGGSWQTSHPPSAQGSAPPPTFAQMQANGQARPAPPPQYNPQYNPQYGQQSGQYGQAPSMPGGASSYGGSGVSGTLNSAVQQALANPSAYGSQQVMDSYTMLNQQLGQDYDYQRKQLNDELASRGLSASTIAGQRYSDVATEQARAQANMATQLATQAAQTYGQDRNNAIQSGIGLGNLDLSSQLGFGNLGVAQENAGTNAQSVANQYSLGQGQLGISQQAQDLAKQLGLGNLGIAQQSADTQQQSVANQYALGQGQLGISQQAQDLAKQLGLGNLNLSQQQFGLDQLKNTQQYGLQQADLTGTYNGQQTLASKAQQTAQQQFQAQLQQALQLAQMSDKTANRGIDVQGQTNINQLMMQLAMLGIGGGGLGLGGSSIGGSGMSGSSGASGSSSSSTTGGSGYGNLNALSPGYSSYLNSFAPKQSTGSLPGDINAAESAAQQANPQTFAMMMLTDGYKSHPTWTTDTYNFNGQQYTSQQYYMLMAQHPEMFKPQAPQMTLDGPQQGGGQLAQPLTTGYYQPSASSTTYQNPANQDAWLASLPPAVRDALANPSKYSVGGSTGGMVYTLGAANTPQGALFYRNPQTGQATRLSPEEAQRMTTAQQSNPYAMSDPDGLNRFFVGQDAGSGQIYDPTAGRWVDPNTLDPQARAALMAQYGGQ